MNDLKKILEFTERIGRKAGDKLLVFQKKLDQLEITDKQVFGVASNADVEIEKYIIKNIKKEYPHHDILAEECAHTNYSHHKLAEFAKKEFCWVIDPLDGTNNFLSFSDYFSVSIAFLSFGIPLVGVIYRPGTDECFSAIRDQKATLREKANTSILKKGTNDKKLKDSMLINSSVFTLDPQPDQEFNRYKDLTMASRGVRRFGSAALDLCYLALGHWDGFWGRGLSPWDVAAAMLICREANIKITDYQGVDFTPFSSSIIAARDPFFSRFKQYFSS
ncbi:MAG: inositol monophosphatase [Halobacteriovoraceae bacterium]|nr:inositol monophosphatase [Halobacteriovoraceae bacterium]